METKRRMWWRIDQEALIKACSCSAAEIVGIHGKIQGLDYLHWREETEKNGR